MSSFLDALNLSNSGYLGDSTDLSPFPVQPAGWLAHRAGEWSASFSDRALSPWISHSFSSDLSDLAENSVQPTAVASDPSAFNLSYGYGVVDAAAAVTQAIAAGATFPDVPNVGGGIWGLDRVKAPEAWAQGYTGQGVVVAVIDTGVDYTHPDLDNNIWMNTGETWDGIDNDGNGFIDDVLGWDFVNWDNNPMDDDSHGTHVAGTIAAENNGFGVTGVAYNAKIMPIKVLGPNGGSYADVAAGIVYAANQGADVINLSLGGGYFNNLVAAAVQYATEKGAVVVMASGNEGSSQPSFPANLASTWGIAVGAIDSSDRLANFSNRAGTVPLDFVAAPGTRIWSTVPNNTYSAYSGTSMATPHVAGVAALMLSANPTLTPGQVETILIQTANPVGIVA
ncbi:MAG: S8 family serine peptidase [Oscillatoriales cyanobacterium C42_A2020_001]|nr:S8 family serine peptidase [Leptolyngbyaceae cyanobacterium C42_A2020_001]